MGSKAGHRGDIITRGIRVVFQSCKGWVVLGPDGSMLFGPTREKAYAQAAADKARREADAGAGRGMRKCMCCQAEFRSDGRHNRLCGDCGKRDGGPVPAGFAMMTKRAGVQR
jgi:hypothetical protein